MYINDEQSIDGSHEGDDAGNENQNRDFINANLLDKKQLEVLKSFVDWEVESDRYIIFDQFFRLIGDWKGPLSDLRDIFQPEEIERLLLDSISRWGTTGGENQAAQFIRFLVQTGHKDKPKIDKDGKLMLHRFTPIHDAEYDRDYPVARELFKIYDRFDANYIHSIYQYSHFHAACEWGCIDIVEKFLELGQLDINLLAMESNSSPLQSALAFEHAEVIELLLRNGADPNFAEEDGSTILHTICYEKNNVELAKMVFEHCQVEYKPVQVDTQDSDGYTPMRHAVDRGNQSMIELLLRNGVDPNLPDDDGFTPLHVICGRESDDADFLGAFFKICKDTRQKLQIEARDKKGRTPLQWAVGNIMPNTVDVLLDQGVDLSSFVFPTAKQFDGINEYRKHDWDFKLQLASGLLIVVERLEKRGYELDQSDALTIMAFLTEYEAVESSDVVESWYDDENFEIEAKKIMVNPSLSLYELIRLRPTEAAEILTYTDYFELGCTEKVLKLPTEFGINCAKHLCEKLARRFFRRWTLYPFWEKIVHYRLPLLCCDLIIDHLTNKDLFNICLAATKPRRRPRYSLPKFEISRKVSIIIYWEMLNKIKITCNVMSCESRPRQWLPKFEIYQKFTFCRCLCRITQTIPLENRCDNEYDCEDISDEQNCTCKEYLRNTNPSAICDGHVDCHDGTDEENCGTKRIIENLQGRRVSLSPEWNLHTGLSQVRSNHGLQAQRGRVGLLHTDRWESRQLGHGQEAALEHGRRRHELRQRRVAADVLPPAVPRQRKAPRGRREILRVSRLQERRGDPGDEGAQGAAAAQAVRQERHDRLRVPAEAARHPEARRQRHVHGPADTLQADPRQEAHRPSENQSAHRRANLPLALGGPHIRRGQVRLLGRHPRRALDTRQHGLPRGTRVSSTIRSYIIKSSFHLPLNSLSRFNVLSVNQNYTTAVMGSSSPSLLMSSPYQQVTRITETRQVEKSDAILLRLENKVNMTRYVQPLYLEKRVRQVRDDLRQRLLRSQGEVLRRRKGLRRRHGRAEELHLRRVPEGHRAQASVRRAPSLLGQDGREPRALPLQGLELQVQQVGDYDFRFDSCLNYIIVIIVLERCSQEYSQRRNPMRTAGLCLRRRTRLSARRGRARRDVLRHQTRKKRSVSLFLFIRYNENNREREVLRYTYGVKHTECLPEPVQSQQNVTGVCKRMGYTSGIQTESYKPTESQYLPRNDYYMFTLNPHSYVVMRDDKSLGVWKKPETPCYRLFDFDWDSSVNFRILSSFFWGYAITQVPGAYLANFMHSPHRCLALGLVLSSFCTVLVHALAVNYGWKSVVALRFFTGLGQGVVFPCVQMLLSKWAPPGERARLGTRSGTGSVVLNSTQFGSVVTMALSGLLSKSVLGWPSIFYFFGACGLVWSLCYFYLGDDSPAVSPRISAAAEREYIETSLGGPVYDAVTVICDLDRSSRTGSIKSYPSHSYETLHGSIRKYRGGAYSRRCPSAGSATGALRRGFCSTELARKLANSVGMMSPALGMTCLSLLQTQNRYVLVSVLVLSIGLTAATTCGFLINYMDLTPQFAGAIMSVSNVTGTLMGIASPLACGYIITDLKNAHQWHLVFYLTAGIYAASNLFFVIFGKATIQPWNHINVPSQQTVSRK
ncbi:unnamed protein product [Trichogramma brassicae]|uniref:Peptidase S1A nudel domain-containing protein n=1 Tax=Trichogramma brassicae TaxID=86971 RepID=A0A6H5I1M6_9HYME|nr:unnamed protein product [Trichogramma brassicae]